MLMYPLPILLYIHFYIVFIHLLLVFTHVMRRPCLCTKLWQNVAEVLHNNRIKFPKDFFRCCPVHEHGHCDITRKRRVGRSWVMYLLCIVQKETNGSCHYSEVCALLRSSGNKNISDTVSYCLVYSTSFLFLPHFDVIYDLLLNRCMATWNLFVEYMLWFKFSFGVKFLKLVQFLFSFVVYSLP